ncbi:shikimate dehydrogenase [Salinimicrobium catena]|uniref:Shikimate dehydrogenase n=1 Tax=Salinimicrobium catena TaxID=390640 RepID=A0A1H5P9K7_9FLAO|nr:shikimate dehydrogenase [Salinimicrobium catena]SDL74021.1 shikimate dehydrogenase [Salinimicrobium catena]SEF10390.1 shikimate dehydrogenase [Salinimicrobium catena]
MLRFGLLGRNISYSFSRGYFSEKFSREGISATYENFDLQELSQFSEVLKKNPDLKGLNVTIPYKEQIIPFLDELDPVAAEIGAVNTIKFTEDHKLVGFNTDHFGFAEAIRPHLKPHHKKALILGTGGASKAVHYALKTLDINVHFVSRSAGKNFSYEDLGKTLFSEHTVIVNCTPLGTFPNTDQYPPVPVQLFTSQHLVFDLIYNPPQTKLMELARKKGATAVNGQKMLEFQAEKAWEIWNS